MQFIVDKHNLKPKKYHFKEVDRYGKEAGVPYKYVWVDKANGRIHLESTDANILEYDEPLMMWWMVNVNRRDKMPYSQQVREELNNMPLVYNAVLRIKLEPYQANNVDQALQRVELRRENIDNATFGIVNYPTIMSAIMPHSRQLSAQPTHWVRYMAVPLSNILMPSNNNTYIYQIMIKENIDKFHNNTINKKY